MRPSEAHRWYGPALLVNLAAQVGIIVTGGLVRLTGSGLGCPSWPQCTPGHFTPVARQAQGWHKYIEFGNRTLTGLLVVAAVAAFVAVLRWAPRRSLVVAALAVIGGVLVQIVLGGVSVLAGLSPVIVSAHFLVSSAIVAAAAYLYLARDERSSAPRLLVPTLLARAAAATAALGGLVIVLGTVVTGSGPHSGDAAHPTRYGFDPRTVSWLHADAVMLFTGLAVAVWLGVRLVGAPERTRKAWTGVLHVIVLQGVVGYVQFYLGVPAALVALHMLLAALLVVALTRGLLSLRDRVPVVPVVPTAQTPA